MSRTRRSRGRREYRRRYRELLRAVLARHGPTYHLCGGEIDPDPELRRQYHPASLTLDHVVPRRDGGADEPNNLRPAHRSCNMDKDRGRLDRVAVERRARVR